MNTANDRIARLLGKLDATWNAFQESYAGLTDDDLLESGVTGDWSVKDILAHVTAWEEEALTHLPTILDGGRPPNYSDVHGGIDAVNAQLTEQGRTRSLARMRRQLEATHQRLLDYVRDVPPEQLVGETRFRRRLRDDTYGHYPEHTEAIRSWREQRSAR